VRVMNNPARPGLKPSTAKHCNYRVAKQQPVYCP